MTHTQAHIQLCVASESVSGGAGGGVECGQALSNRTHLVAAPLHRPATQLLADRYAAIGSRKPASVAVVTDAPREVGADKKGLESVLFVVLLIGLKINRTRPFAFASAG